MSADPKILPFTPRSSCSLQSDIPRDHRYRESIEAACRRAFEDLPGSWTVEIRLASKGPTWALRITPSLGIGFTRTIVLAPTDQNGTSVTRRLRGIVAELRCLPLGA